MATLAAGGPALMLLRSYAEGLFEHLGAKEMRSNWAGETGAVGFSRG